MPRVHGQTNYNLEDMDEDMFAYLNQLFSEHYKQWKSDLHQCFQQFDDPQVTLEEGCPKELKDRQDSWVWLCGHFQEPGLWQRRTRSIRRRRLFSTIRVRGLSLIGWRRDGRVQNFRRLTSLLTFMFGLGMSLPSPFMRLWWRKVSRCFKSPPPSFSRTRLLSMWIPLRMQGFTS
ncbi:uncharacterized protein LOC126608541 isoform X2 [Malus sylvestris]|uniref:uncharacterized protein LOC126608541 isoform X2 n=1 Tax=Malus sylvestris TaxID=3752 RepID=UPI0021AC432D|nr:uncharacterized protein LOC126608541 isoform X2 [Malus sylvestris]